MNRFPIAALLTIMLFLFVAADGCSSDPNVEGAKLDLRNKQYDRAIENLNIALETNPQNAEALELKGQVLAEKAYETADAAEHVALIEEAMEAYERAVDVDPTLQEAVTNARRLAYQSEFQRGVQAFNRGRNQASEYDTSVLYFRSAGQIMPDSAGAHVNEAFALLNADRQDEAIGPFEMAIEKGDTELDTYSILATLYQQNDRASDAVSLLETASEIHPNSEDLQSELLNAYQLAGETDRAMDMYQQAVTNNPENKLFRYNYGSLLLQNNRYDEALEQLRRAVEIDPEYGNAHYNIGAAYINQAVALNEEIIAMDDELRENRSSMSQSEIEATDANIMDKANERTELFRLAIEPLERARSIFDTTGEDATDVCQALFQSYVQTDQTDLAQGVSACAGFDDTSNN